jgi:phosphate transport system permease protein
MRPLFWLTALLGAVVPLLMLWDIIANGLPGLSIEFLSQPPTDTGRSGGILPILFATVWILAICLSVTLPLGLGCAIYLSEYIDSHSSAARWIGLSLDILASTPSIIFGLFGYALFAIYLNFGFSLLSGGLSLACMVLPLFIRTTEHALRACPIHYRQAASALNIRQSGFILRILLPISGTGIAVALILSSGRALAETAVLIFTAGYVSRQPDSVFDSGRTLSVHIYDLSMNVPGGQQNAAASALVLVLLIMLINSTARLLARRYISYDQTPL